MRHKGVNFIPWSVCDRCGFQYPLGQLVAQKGLMVCTLYCFDNTDIEYRPLQIQQVLDSGGEGVPDTPEVRWNPEEIRF